MVVCSGKHTRLIVFSDPPYTCIVQKDRSFVDRKTDKDGCCKVFGAFKDMGSFILAYEKSRKSKELFYYENKESNQPVRVFFDVDIKFSERMSDSRTQKEIGKEFFTRFQLFFVKFWWTVFKDIEPPKLCAAICARPEKVGIHIHAVFEYGRHFANLKDHKVFRNQLFDFAVQHGFLREDEAGILDASVYETGAFRLVYSRKKEIKSGKLRIAPPYEPLDPSVNHIRDYLVTFISDRSLPLPSLNEGSLPMKGRKRKITESCQTSRKKTSAAEECPGIAFEETEDLLRAAQLEVVRKAFSKLSVARSVNYDTWMNVGFAMRNIQAKYGWNLMGLFEQFSRKSPKHQDRWEEAKARFLSTDDPHDGYKIGIPTLLEWVLVDSSEKLVFPTEFSVDKESSVTHPLVINPDESMPQGMNDIQYGHRDIISRCDQPYDIVIPNATPLCRFNYFIKCDYGIGKTTRLVAEINKGYRDLQNAFGITSQDRMIIITFRVTLSEKYKADLFDIGFTSYQDSKKKTLDSQYLVVQLESLGRVKIPELADSGASKLVLVLDESESLLKHFESSTMNNRSESLHRLCALMSVARTVVTMDRDLGPRTYQFVTTLRDVQNVVCINTYKNHADESVGIASDLDELVRYLDCDVKHGRKFALCSNSKAAADVIMAFLSSTFPRKKFKYFSSDTSSSSRSLDMRDLILALKEYDGVIFTPTILAGVSYDAKDILRMYIVATRHSCGPREVSQMMRRIRHVIPPPLEPDDLLQTPVQYIYAFVDNWNPTINRAFTYKTVQRFIAFKNNSENYLRMLDTPLSKLHLHTSTYSSNFVKAFSEAHTFNVLETLDGFWNFNFRFLAHMKASGVVVCNLPHLDPDTAFNETLSVLAKHVKNTKLALVANAPLLSDEEYESLSKSSDVTPDQKARMQKYDLCKFYNITSWLCTVGSHVLGLDNLFRFSFHPKFVETYSRSKTKHIYSLWSILIHKGYTTMDHYIKAVENSPSLFDTLETLNSSEVAKLHLMHQRVNGVAEIKLAIEIIQRMGWNTMEDPSTIHSDRVKANILNHISHIRPYLSHFISLPSDDKACYPKILEFCRNTLDVPHRVENRYNYFSISPNLFVKPPASWSPSQPLPHVPHIPTWKTEHLLAITPCIYPTPAS